MVLVCYYSPCFRGVVCKGGVGVLVRSSWLIYFICDFRVMLFRVWVRL